MLHSYHTVVIYTDVKLRRTVVNLCYNAITLYSHQQAVDDRLHEAVINLDTVKYALHISIFSDLA
jgi:hypothetical protein